MPRITRSALLATAASKVYEIVNDIEHYPTFVPWCVDATIIEQTDTTLVASLHVKTKIYEGSFTTHNKMIPIERVTLALIDGPFDHFDGEWLITPLGGDTGCRIELSLDFEFRSRIGRLFGRSLKGSVDKAADRIVDAFCHRVKVVTQRDQGAT